MAFAPRSARLAKVRINNTVLTAKEWNVNPNQKEYDLTNFEGNGQGYPGPTISDLDVDITFDMDGNQNPYDVPLNLAEGQVVAAKLYLNDTAGPFWNIPFLLVLSATTSAKVREYITSKITAKGQPGWTRPTGAF